MEYGAKTQKAKGIFAINHFKALENLSFMGKAVEHTWKPIKFPCFARPCPKRPRHGFVDSKVVNNPEEAAELIQKTLEIDPDGEVLFAPILDATYSAIWTPGLISIGPGNDGATAGKNSFALKVENTDWVPSYTKERAELSQKDI